MQTVLRPDSAIEGPLKWPSELVMIRHGESVYNQSKEDKKTHSWYQLFVKSYEAYPDAIFTWFLAKMLEGSWKLPHSDADTPLTSLGHHQSYQTGQRLSQVLDKPDVVLCSPYTRTRQTYAGLVEGWTELGQVRMLEDLRLREQRHGLATLYNDRRIFHALNRIQRQLYEQEGEYYYVYPQGDSVEDVRERIMLWFATLVREFAGQRVLVVSHHLTILSVMANLERWTAQEFIAHDHEQKPRNCSVTRFVGNPGLGNSRQGTLTLESYNQVFYRT